MMLDAMANTKSDPARAAEELLHEITSRLNKATRERRNDKPASMHICLLGVSFPEYKGVLLGCGAINFTDRAEQIMTISIQAHREGGALKCTPKVPPEDFRALPRLPWWDRFLPVRLESNEASVGLLSMPTASGISIESGASIHWRAFIQTLLPGQPPEQTVTIVGCAEFDERKDKFFWPGFVEGSARM